MEVKHPTVLTQYQDLQAPVQQDKLFVCNKTHGSAKHGCVWVALCVGRTSYGWVWANTGKNAHKINIAQSKELLAVGIHSHTWLNSDTLLFIQP